MKGTRQKVIVTHNPSEIDQAQELLVRCPNLGNDDIIIPGKVNISFNIELTSTIDANRTLVSNIGRAIVKKLAVKFEGNKITSVDDFDVFFCYRDLWKTKSEKRNAIRQGIVSNDGCTENCINPISTGLFCLIVALGGGGGVFSTPFHNSFVFKVRLLKFCTEILSDRMNNLR